MMTQKEVYVIPLSTARGLCFQVIGRASFLDFAARGLYTAFDVDEAFRYKTKQTAILAKQHALLKQPQKVVLAHAKAARA